MSTASASHGLEHWPPTASSRSRRWGDSYVAVGESRCPLFRHMPRQGASKGHVPARRTSPRTAEYTWAFRLHADGGSAPATWGTGVHPLRCAYGPRGRFYMVCPPAPASRHTGQYSTRRRQQGWVRGASGHSCMIRQLLSVRRPETYHRKAQQGHMLQVLHTRSPDQPLATTCAALAARR